MSASRKLKNINIYLIVIFLLLALGQLMLYIEGMNGVVSHNETIQWLYNLSASNVRLSAY